MSNNLSIDTEVISKGEPVAVGEGNALDVEAWVKLVAAHADARLDWCYAAGRVWIFHLGDASSLRRTYAVMHMLRGTLVGGRIHFILDTEHS